MYEKIIKKILESVNENSDAQELYPEFSQEGYNAVKIDKKNFHRIEKAVQSKKIAFIDGGNSQIIGSANFSLDLARVCCVVYENKKKVAFKKCDFFIFTNAVKHDNKICYKASFFETENSDFLKNSGFSQGIYFNSFDRTLMLGISRADISSVANAVRRFAELRMAKIISEKNDFCDIIVLDGNLQSTLTDENRYLNEIYESCSSNNVILAALSKTTSLFTNNGNLLSAVLSDISNLSSWHYHPIAEINNPNHKAEMFFVKFHDKSRHIFRFEIFNLQKSKAEEAINILAGNCIDPIFIGYPYGLVEADRLARVTNQEKEYLKTMFLIKLRNGNIEKYLSSANAHEILDKASF